MGTTPCSNDVLDWIDPFYGQPDSSSWSFTGARSNVGPLQQGSYYISVRAFNTIIRGGPLSTALCNSVPLVVDITGPIMNSFTVNYMDATATLYAVYNVT